MYLYVEQWNVTQKWMDLSKEERRDYMGKVSESMEGFLNEAGIENLGWALNDEHTPYRSDYRYMAIWKMKNLEDVEKFEKGIKESGWHKYFSQHNSRGEVIPLNSAIEFLVDLEKNATSLED